MRLSIFFDRETLTYLSYAFGMLLIGTAVLYSVRPEEADPIPIDNVVTKKLEIIETGIEPEILFSEKGKVQVRIKGDKLLRHVVEDDPYLEFTEGLEVSFFDGRMEEDSKLTANYGIKYEKQEELTVRGNVVVLNTKGEKLETEELIWNEKTQKIYSEKFVKITTPKEIIYGDGFESNQDFTDYKIKKIKGHMNVNEDEIL